MPLAAPMQKTSVQLTSLGLGECKEGLVSPAGPISKFSVIVPLVFLLPSLMQSIARVAVLGASVFTAGVAGARAAEEPKPTFIIPLDPAVPRGPVNPQDLYLPIESLDDQHEVNPPNPEQERAEVPDVLNEGQSFYPPFLLMFS